MFTLSKRFFISVVIQRANKEVLGELKFTAGRKKVDYKLSTQMYIRKGKFKRYVEC